MDRVARSVCFIVLVTAIVVQSIAADWVPFLFFYVLKVFVAIYRPVMATIGGRSFILLLLVFFFFRSTQFKLTFVP